MIDKKGKLFGKLNIIDLIAILLIVAVVALLGYKLTHRENGGLAGEGQKIVYTVQVSNVEPEVYAFIQTQLPSQLTAADKMLEAHVTNVEATPAEQSTFTVKEGSNAVGRTLSVVDKDTYDLVFTIEGTVKDPLTSELGTQEIRVGKSHIVKTPTFELEGGIILSCEREEVPAAAES